METTKYECSNLTTTKSLCVDRTNNTSQIVSDLIWDNSVQPTKFSHNTSELSSSHNKEELEVIFRDIYKILWWKYTTAHCLEYFTYSYEDIEFFLRSLYDEQILFSWQWEYKWDILQKIDYQFLVSTLYDIEHNYNIYLWTEHWKMLITQIYFPHLVELDKRIKSWEQQDYVELVKDNLYHNDIYWIFHSYANTKRNQKTIRRNKWISNDVALAIHKLCALVESKDFVEASEIFGDFNKNELTDMDHFIIMNLIPPIKNYIHLIQSFPAEIIKELYHSKPSHFQQINTLFEQLLLTFIKFVDKKPKKWQIFKRIQRSSIDFLCLDGILRVTLECEISKLFRYAKALIAEKE